MFFLPAHASVTVVLAAADGRRVVECLNYRHHLSAPGLGDLLSRLAGVSRARVIGRRRTRSAVGRSIDRPRTAPG